MTLQKFQPMQRDRCADTTVHLQAVMHDICHAALWPRLNELGTVVVKSYREGLK